ncbi:hypothetical protein Y032_0025g1108 [Ancylostoma ceylanicum]|uniref:Uncharacterized protein n=1 Tax=Ancylostoma ceylanicum TaxID=53326 RepID=A0A016UV02_9BILA|nr:hypothetical protein Y032_0025g1108 [Ancylostoma ceylanicum]
MMTWNAGKRGRLWIPDRVNGLVVPDRRYIQGIRPGVEVASHTRARIDPFQPFYHWLKGYMRLVFGKVGMDQLARVYATQLLLQGESPVTDQYRLLVT